ncbi:peptidylprolyl isomerase [Fluviicola taffensis]|uniref:PpiC-type peptidyl-prolyl cis-trans isomerase n=1 Tax=Fluviicola taffensis (strain DSM 16823 / NCIMB 13979 / RW262) TaxID=755732 RepID=F2IK47_FLUTR|nr:peptidylprolyl isomerase [Fluviicola taffensis]AEA42946.1 PpiC-type peptidyl-prolyl cis-trans isomerase [Fluviicola taffensis DSM 16823]
MKYQLLISFLFTLAFTNVFAQPKMIDKVIGQVGDNIVLYSELEGQKQSLKQNSAVPESIDQCVLLEQMLYNFLLVNQAELDSIQISDEQVDAEMENRLRVIENQMKNVKDDKGNPITIESFYGKTKSQIKEEFRVTIKKRLQGQEVERGITADLDVSPMEVENFFNSIPKDSLPYINSQLSFQQIAIFPKITKSDKEIAQKKIVEIRKSVVSGKMTMCAAAFSNSDDPGSAKNCGRYEATRGMMARTFEATAYSLKVGEISEVFETEFGFHFMQLIDRKGDDYIVSHILISPKFSLDSLDASSKRMEKCYEDLKQNKYTWDDAVRIYSNDVNTKENKGFITNPITGEIKWSIEQVNEVDPMMFQLTDGLEINQVTSPNLYYDFNERKEAIRIVRVAERTKPHVGNLKDDYNLFRMMALEDKKQKVILAWTKTKISTAYIRIDDSFKDCVFQNQWIPKAP